MISVSSLTKVAGRQCISRQCVKNVMNRLTGPSGFVETSLGIVKCSRTSFHENHLPASACVKINKCTSTSAMYICVDCLRLTTVCVLQGSVGSSLFHAFSNLWIFAGVLHLTSCSLSFAAPLLLREFLKNIPSAHPNAQLIGIFWATVMALCALGAILIRMQCEIALRTVKLDMSRSIQQMLYEKTLKISQQAKASFGMGNVTNLWINDTNMLLECVRQGHYLWGTPFQVRSCRWMV